MDNQVLNVICDKILPKINDKVNKLTIEPNSLKRILCVGEYSQLYSLSLINFQQEGLLQNLKDNSFFYRLFTDQITNFIVQIQDEITSTEVSQTNESNLFSIILSKCKRLSILTFSQFFSDQSLTISIFNLPSTSCVSSILTKLNIYVNTFDDCLFLLDGRLPWLSTLIINIIKIFNMSSNIDNTKKLPKLKCFSLESYCHTFFYDSQIVPLLHRMSNLEELTLFIAVIRNESAYIDGNHLYNEILIHMPRLNQFIFSISTTVYNISMKIDLPSNNDIQRSFIEKGKQVGSYVKNDSTMITGECRIYSIPYKFNTFLYLTDAFPGGRFNNVQCLVMADTQPFEHQLFKIITQDFPFLRKLSVINSVAQQNKKHSSSCNIFHHLLELRLDLSHIDYVEQFFFERNTSLPCLLSLHIEYETLAILTNNFTNDASRKNCAQLQRLIIKESFVRPENFHSYFPLL